jgi:hypothetical protein
MAYALLILEVREQRVARSEAQGQEAYRQMIRFQNELQTRGVLLAAEALKTEAQRVSIEAPSRRRMVDGPFSEAKELVGGFFLLDCDTEEAQEIALQCPAAEWATVELREVGPCYQN